MEILIMILINAILTECLSYVNTLLDGLITVALHAENSMGTLLGTNGFVNIFNIFLSVGISLIVLKFLKKGFEGRP